MTTPHQMRARPPERPAVQTADPEDGSRRSVHGLLGTVIDVRVRGATEPKQVADTVFAEIERLEHVFNWFEPTSELRRWSRGETEPGPELGAVLELADSWRLDSDGAFDPAAGHLVALWEQAAATQAVPNGEQIRKALDQLPRHRRFAQNLNGIAKGWIIDRAARLAFDMYEPTSLTVNGGGDLVHLGAPAIIVGVEDPHRAYDNIPPRHRVEIESAALATSGIRRRGWWIGGQFFGHVVDPLTGYPVGQVASASVIAPELVTADVVATILTVIGIDEGLAFCDRADLACRLVDTDGGFHSNHRWRAAESHPPTSHLPARSQ